MGCASSGQVAGSVSGQRRLSMRPHSLETRILQVERVDSVLFEASTNQQPEAPFSGTQLGVKNFSSAVELVQEGQLFSDLDFPPDQTSLGFKEPVQWLRSKELGVADQVWTGKCRGNIISGGLHSTWLAEALAIVALQPKVLDKVFISQQISRGYVRLKLWRFGTWETVVVDDRIPVSCCITTSCVDEVWPAVIEKAFAKLYGSYAALAGGNVLWGLEDLTGGVAQRLEAPAEAAALYAFVYRPLQQALQAGVLVSCKSAAPAQRSPESTALDTTRGGPTRRSAASISAQISDKPIHFVSVINARRTESGHEIQVRNDLPNTLPGDKEQWVDVKDFIVFYTSIIVTTLQTDVQRFQMKHTFGCWEGGVSAGGSRNDLEKFATNPQYLLTVKQPDDTEESEDFGRCSFIFALMQEHRRSSKSTKPPLLPIACFIYKADVPDERLSAEYFLCVSEEASTGPFVNRREASLRAELAPGNYIVIPATWTSGQQSTFLLRVCALKEFSMQALPPHMPNCAMLLTWVPVTEM